jgi:hypothetical protein
VGKKLGHNNVIMSKMFLPLQELTTLCRYEGDYSVGVLTTDALTAGGIDWQLYE